MAKYDLIRCVNDRVYFAIEIYLRRIDFDQHILLIFVWLFIIIFVAAWLSRVLNLDIFLACDETLFWE
jgi:hypothetical protein